MTRIGLALRLGLAAALLCGQSAAAKAAGHWVTSSGAEPEMYLIYPEYSPNTWAVFLMSCNPARRTVRFIEDTEENDRPRSSTLPLRVDGRPFPMTGRLEFNEMDEFWQRHATVPYSAPAVRALVAARSIGLDGWAQTRSLPATRFSVSLATWLKACRLR